MSNELGDNPEAAFKASTKPGVILEDWIWRTKNQNLLSSNAT